jgi:hypothetical protein
MAARRSGRRRGPYVVRLDDLEKQAKLLADPTNSPGTIAVTADEAGRYTRFAISMQMLQAPAGTGTLWQIGNDIAGNRNSACESFSGDWIWFIDDDHAFRPDVLVALLARNVDIVTPLCLRRTNPFLPIPCVDEDFMDITRYRGDELAEVEHAGSSGMLIRRRVLEAVPKPWFELGNGISEDVNFCRKAVQAGFKIHVDMAVRLGHITTAVVWPVYDDERWYTGFTIADGAKLAIDPAPIAELDPAEA